MFQSRRKQQQILPRYAIHLNQPDCVRCGSLCWQLEQPVLAGGFLKYMPAYYSCALWPKSHYGKPFQSFYIVHREHIGQSFFRQSGLEIME